MTLLENPRLHSGVTLQPFDTTNAMAVYLLTSSHGRRWQIPESHSRFLLLMDGTRSLSDLQRELDTGGYPGLSGCRVDEILAKFVMPCHLLESSLSTVATVARNQRQSQPISTLTLTLPLIKSARLEFVTRLSRRLFAGWCAVVVLLFGALLQIISWRFLMSELSVGHPSFTVFEVVGFVLIALLSPPIHELGHLSAAHRFGCSTGDIGVGVYLVFPVMYVDLSAVWALPRAQRVIINAGGIYFQFIGAAILAAVHVVTGNMVYEFLALGYLVTAAVNINPLLKLDGYWCLSDWLGVPNLHSEARARLHRSVAQSLGWPMRPDAFGYHEWHKRLDIFLMIFAAAHIAFFCLVIWSIVLILPSAANWLNPTYLTKFLARLTDAPFTPGWWRIVPRQIGHLLLSLGIMIMLGRMTIHVIRKTVSIISSRLRHKLGATATSTQ